MSASLQNLPVSATLILVGLLLIACCYVAGLKVLGGTFIPSKLLKWLLHIIGFLLLLVGLLTLAKEHTQRGKDAGEIEGSQPTSSPSSAPISASNGTDAASTANSTIRAATPPRDGVKPTPAVNTSGINTPKPAVRERQQVIGGDACLSPNGDVQVGGNLDISGCNKEPTK